MKHLLPLLLVAGLRASAAVIATSKVPEVPNDFYRDFTGYNQPLSEYDEALRNYLHALSNYEDAMSPRYIGGSSPPSSSQPSLIDSRKAVKIRAPQETCPPQPTVTVTVIQGPPTVSVVAGDPISIASSFAYASGIDSIVYQNSIEDRPTGNAPETTPIFFTHTASGPEIVATDDPNDGTGLYHLQSTTLGPVATTTVSFPAADTPSGAPRQNGPGTPTSTNSASLSSLDTGDDGIVTVTTYLSTATEHASPAVTSAASSLSATARILQKRQTCTLIFAEINGRWASWCNNWDGSTTVSSYSTYNTTTVVTSVYGADPVPSSVYDPSHTMPTSNAIESSPSANSAEGAKSTSYPTSLPESPTSPSLAEPAPDATSIIVTASVVVTYPVTTITGAPTGEEPSPTGTAAPGTTFSCGQVGTFVISFDDLPSFNTNNPNTTDIPPIFAPYDHFYWSNGYGYGPPPSEPYAPHDGSRLAMYDPVDDLNPEPSIQGRGAPGSFGAGPRAANSVYWFDAKSVYVGCNSTASSAPCDVVATGYRWVRTGGSTTEGYEKVAFSQQYSIPPVCASPPCQLTQVFFDPARFSGLSTINLQAYFGNATIGFFLDSFQAAWTNNTCAAGIERQDSRK